MPLPSQVSHQLQMQEKVRYRSLLPIRPRTCRPRGTGVSETVPTRPAKIRPIHIQPQELTRQLIQSTLRYLIPRGRTQPARQITLRSIPTRRRHHLPGRRESVQLHPRLSSSMIHQRCIPIRGYGTSVMRTAPMQPCKTRSILMQTPVPIRSS